MCVVQCKYLYILKYKLILYNIQDRGSFLVNFNLYKKTVLYNIHSIESVVLYIKWRGIID